MGVRRILASMMVWTGLVQTAAAVSYERDIKPLFAEKCGACHGALMQQAGLRLDAGVLIRKGSDNGPVVVPGSAAESPLIGKVTAEDPDVRMPPEGEGEPLNAQQVALLTAWINAGAVVPEDEAIPVRFDMHWAYQVPQRRPLPQVDDSRWSHPIDSFIAHEHRRQGLTAVEQANRHTLLRRVYLDLIGLPPTRAQLQAFVQDESPDAWQGVVDALLESPHYGERWGRHWMDVWRYSDWDGYKGQLRGSQRHIWRWRDWIVQSLNADKGYDRMIVEMLAGDEITPADPSALRATGFLARNFHNSNRNMWLDATVEHTAKAFLGLTLDCARCHDHKYDPIQQTAYYQFRAIFEPHSVRIDRLPGQPDLMKDGLPRAFDTDLSAKTFLFLQGNEKHPDTEHPIVPAVPAILGGILEIQPVELSVDAYYPWLRDFVVKEQLAAAQSELDKANKALADATARPAAGSEETSDQDRPPTRLLELEQAVSLLRLHSLQTRHAADGAKYVEEDAKQTEVLALVAARVERRFNVTHSELTVNQKQAALRKAESGGEKDAAKRQAAGEEAREVLSLAEKNLKAAQDAVKKLDGNYTPLGDEYPRTSSGRRLALARWIADHKNPLTARVAVNHIWLRHFGSPLVDNVFDFGLRSPRPRHAALLDWLAVELMENNWSMKHLHQLIVTSRTWRLASSGSAAEESHNQSVDRDNRGLWRMNSRRVEAEIIRDSILAVSAQLDATLGGTEIDFREGEVSRRRSIYLRHAYEKQMTMLVLFDVASPNECYRRSESIVPQQALALANSSLSLSQSRLLARRLWHEIAPGSDPPRAQFVRLAFLQILSRPPADEELAACLEFLVDQAATLSDSSKLSKFVGGSTPQVKPAAEPRLRALENLVHVLINHNDFVTVR